MRVAGPSDFARMAALEALAGQTRWSEAAFRATLADAHARAWVDEGLGHLLARRASEEGEILTVVVHAEARRNGVGRRLVEAALAWWADGGVREGFLEVAVDNVAARSLYGAVGFREVGRRPRYYADGTDAVVMRWSPS